MNHFSLSEEYGIERLLQQLGEDAAVSQMLDFLAADIRHRPERLLPLNSDLINLITSLVGHAKVDLNLPLLADDE